MKDRIRTVKATMEGADLPEITNPNREIKPLALDGHVRLEGQVIHVDIFDSNRETGNAHVDGDFFEASPEGVKEATQYIRDWGWKKWRVTI